MNLFWQHLFEHAFLQYAILAGVLASVACGVIGIALSIHPTDWGFNRLVKYARLDGRSSAR